MGLKRCFYYKNTSMHVQGSWAKRSEGNFCSLSVQYIRPWAQQQIPIFISLIQPCSVMFSSLLNQKPKSNLYENKHCYHLSSYWSLPRTQNCTELLLLDITDRYGIKIAALFGSFLVSNVSTYYLNTLIYVLAAQIANLWSEPGTHLLYCRNTRKDKRLPRPADKDLEGQCTGLYDY